MKTQVSTSSQVLDQYRHSFTPGLLQSAGCSRCLSRQSPNRTTRAAVGQTSRLHYRLAADADIRFKSADA
jgi:hypothetical protein